MNIFYKVKEAVSVMDAASFYGIKVNRKGMCLCPFHNDRNPSMKVDKRFHCFGCQKDGDVIDFVGKLFSLTPLEAARKIAGDFCIATDNDSSTASGHGKNSLDPRLDEQKQKDRDFKKLVDFAICVICDFHRYWWKVRESELPDPYGEWSDRFCKACDNVNLAAEWLKILENGSEVEKRELLDHFCNR
ncbi:MAG: DNA primase [Lachnospiraceae bacterium]|nr:DNA primase [Lachnospiraceae bacterium]